MNRIVIIGNLTKDCERRVANTQNGPRDVVSFTVAVNRRNSQQADFFNVTVWDKLAINCGKYLAKGRKVAVEGSVSLHTYTNHNGEQRASLDVAATSVEFLSTAQQYQQVDSTEAQRAFTPEPEQQQMGDLPF